MNRFECFLLGCGIAFFCVVIIYGAYITGYDEAMKLCADHPAECKVLFTNEGTRGLINALR
ncbi:MAG: hypothetical protein M0R47_01375 [Methylobacter sp.]|uniref:hypothetical protein n=1 Tax=Methylobacter sp. TaxID=2051955 RepID=UPI0025E5FF4E|nr:hypothetical protein [Methylobacter sp.]MCK9619166.1 hypothetical protein [Methylobacter sp.]